MCTKAGKSHYDSARDILNQSANSKAAQVWGKFEKEIKVADAHYVPPKGMPEAYHSQGSLYFDVDKISKGDKISKPYQTLFHEGGHCIDYLNRDKATGDFFSVRYKNGEFAKALHSDVDKWISDFKSEFTRHFQNNNVQWFLDNKFISKGALNVDGTLPNYFKYRKDFAYQALEQEIRNIDIIVRADLSDIIEGITKRKVFCGVGHGRKYWQNRTVNGIEHGLMKEAFAEFLDSVIANEESFKILQKYLPNASKVFDEMMKELLK